MTRWGRVTQSLCYGMPLREIEERQGCSIKCKKQQVTQLYGFGVQKTSGLKLTFVTVKIEKKPSKYGKNSGKEESESGTTFRFLVWETQYNGVAWNWKRNTPSGGKTWVGKYVEVWAVGRWQKYEDLQ